MLRLYLFGSPRLERDGTALPLRRSKALALLAYLAVTGRPHSRESLQALLWSEFPDADARNNLRRELSQLRATLGADALRTDRRQVVWAEDADTWVDVAAFTREIAAVRAHTHPGELCESCGRALGAAVQLAVGELLDGFHVADSPAFEDWLFYQREELLAQLGWALEALVEWHAARSELQTALSLARRWLSLDPLLEQPRRALMRLLARAGQPAAALRQYEEAARLLASELGATPEAATTALYEAIKAGELVPAPADAARRPPSEGASAGRAPQAAPELPPLTSFVGRQDEIELLAARLAEPACRLLTLVGPGGIGKTRLAGEVAARCAHAFADGAQFVALSGATKPDHIPGAVAGALGLLLTGSGAGWSDLAAALREREQLLVLDNVEQLLDAAPALAALLHAAPRLKLLLTSREALGLPEEWRWAVTGLALPAEDSAADPERSDAVRLFLARARQRGAAVGRDDLPAVARICRLVGGMPLAIELAAAWTAPLSCQEIAEEIAGGLDLLTARHQVVQERHRSVQAVFDQTWARLPVPLQRTLARLSIFPAGCTREAALAVADAPLPLLSELVERAILQRSADGRYHMHPLVRQYAAQRLRETPAEEDAATAACARHYTGWLGAAFDHAFAGGAVEIIALLRAERDNLRGILPAILAHASGEPLRRVLQLIQNVYFICGPSQEGVELLEAAEAHLRSRAPTPEQELVRAHVLTSLGFFALRQGRLEAAYGHFSASNALFAALGAAPQMGSATDPELGLGMLAMVAGDYRAAGRYAERVRARSEASGPGHNQAYAWYLRAEAAQAQGLLAAAHAAARKALALAHTSGAIWLTAYARNQLGQVAAALGRYDEAEGHFQASYTSREAFHDAEGMALALLGMAEVAARRGEHERAARRYRESLACYAQAGDRGGTARARLGLGRTLAERGDYAAAWREIQAALMEARALDFQHVVLDALVQAAGVLVANGRAAEAIAPLTLALVHPASRADTTRLAEDLLVRCEERAPDSFAASAARGREAELGALVDELLAVSIPSAS